VVAIDILHLIDRLEAVLTASWRIPLTSNLVVPEDEVLDIIDQMRVSIPQEVRQAQRVQQERDRILAQAQEEAERVVALARQQVENLADAHEVSQAAQARADALITRAHEEAKVIRAGADDYVVEVLSGLEQELTRLLTTVRNGLEAISKERASRLAEQPETASES
jgi:cell division septum initiation protein DivIVA